MMHTKMKLCVYRIFVCAFPAAFVCVALVFFGLMSPFMVIGFICLFGLGWQVTEPRAERDEAMTSD